MFIIFATILFGVLFSIWKRSNVLNTTLKLIFGAMSVWGVIIIAQTYNFV